MMLLMPYILFAEETNIIETATVTDYDNDGLTDWDETLTGTNPGDPTSVLAVTNITVQEENTIIEWQSISGKVYEVTCANTITSLATNAQRVGFVYATGGTGTWHQTSSCITSTVFSVTQFYRIQCIVNEEAEQATADMSVFE